jgi:hypothetical protein
MPGMQRKMMPHPKKGYFNKDGKAVPGTTTIIGRFKESGGLIYWAWKQGKEGNDIRDIKEAACTAGTLCHDAVEHYIHGKKYKWTGDKEIVKKAKKSYSAFLEWAKQSQLQVTHTEVSLVSEKYQFGGTLDAMFIQGKRSLGDWKTSNHLVVDNLCQLGAYGILWEENYPDDPITGGYHLVRFTKEHGDFSHNWWGELETAKKMFIRLRDAYDYDKELKKRIG